MDVIYLYNLFNLLVEVFLINELWGVLWEEVDHNKKIASKVTYSKINR
jgi:hypothetical protein